jgi:hypothetical protein
VGGWWWGERIVGMNKDKENRWMEGREEEKWTNSYGFIF